MEFPSSQPTEFFDAPESQPAEAPFGTRESEPDQNQDMRQSDSESLYRHKSSAPQSPNLPPTGQLPHMQLLPPSTENSYVSLSALIEDIDKTAVRQGYNVIKKGGNRKDKNGDLRRICLSCSKGGSYKEDETRIEHGTRERKRQRTDCPWKAYAIRKDPAWTIQIEDQEHNHPPSAPKAFASNRKFCQADIAIIKDDARANITPIKTRARLHNLNPGKYFTIRDLHNARAQIVDKS